MKVIELCQTPILSSEVYSLLRNNPKNALAFSSRDPLDNSDITDSDELRRLVSARRMCAYLESTIGVEKFSHNISSVARELRSQFNLSLDIITRLIDCALVTGNPDIAESARVYLYGILKDLISQGDVKIEDIDSIHETLLGLSKAEAAPAAPPPAAAAEEEPKRKSLRRK